MNRFFFIRLIANIIVAFLLLQLLIPNSGFAEVDFQYILEAEFPGMFNDGSEIRGPLTVAEIETKELIKISGCGSCPQIPFGKINNEWQDFKAQIQAQDIIIYFRSDTKSWQGDFGREGYALIRGDKITKIIITLMN